jgi:putative PIN family toxin of toxin-antitoxin system
MNSGRKKVVIDSNILISAAIYPNSAAAQAYRLAVAFCDVFASQETLDEVAQVLMRSKFDRYFADGGPTREQFLEDYKALVVVAEITEISTDCIDPKDNKFLSLALTVHADIIASGDQKHLIPMHPYRNISILSATDFVSVLSATKAEKM